MCGWLVFEGRVASSFMLLRVDLAELSKQSCNPSVVICVLIYGSDRSCYPLRSNDERRNMIGYRGEQQEWLVGSIEHSPQA
jgi:hypothetical protein